jgi:hypothetical protein
LSAPQRELASRQQADWIDCSTSPVTFVERHVSIEEPDGRVIPFALWGFQRTTLQTLTDDRLVFVLKARRLGLSWLALAYALWTAIFHQGIRVLILCKTETDASELLDRVRRMRDRLAADRASSHILGALPRPAKVRDAVTTLDIGSSTIRALVGTPAAARSETAGLVVADEFAFQRRAGGIWRALLPTIEGGGRLAVISTGDGVSGDGEEFARQWSRASGGESGFTPLFWPWDARPDRDQAWKTATLAQLGDPDRFATEYPETPDDAFRSPDTTFVYDRSGVDAAERLGRTYDALREAGELPPPYGDALHLGIDWGLGTTAGLTIWPLAGGGLYVPPGEVIVQRGEPGDITRRILDAAARYDPPVDMAAYDAAGGQAMLTFFNIAPSEIRSFEVPFGEYKDRVVGFLRQLFRRTHEDFDTRIIAISPHNKTLLSQLRGLRQDDKGKVVKENDHAPDALIAGACPIALMVPDWADV